MEIIAGVATAGIPHGALVADALNIPMIYVRSEAKKHGLTNQIEGVIKPGQKVVVIEDLVSTGGSSLTAVQALRAVDAQVLGMAALFTYAFPVADKAFADAQCTLHTLSDYPALIAHALQSGKVDSATAEILQQWRENPAIWMQ